MTLRTLAPDAISTGPSPLVFSTPFQPTQPNPIVAASLRQLGILQALVIHQTGDGEYHLIDGQHRLQFAKESGLTQVPVKILPPDTPIEDLVTLVYLARSASITSSIITRLLFITLCLNAGLTKANVIQTWLPILDIRPHASILLECKKILALPEIVLRFCHDKRLAFKQCLLFALYANDILETTLAWRSTMQLSASLVLEFAELLRDIIKLEKTEIPALLAHPDLQNILESKAAPAHKTSTVRTYLTRRRNPMLTQSNDQIRTIATSIGTKNITLDWDHTLENKRLDLHLTLRSMQDWQHLRNTMDNTQFSGRLNELLDML